MENEHNPDVIKCGSYVNGSFNSSLDVNQTNNYGHQPLLAPVKVFKCKYCARKFLNPRALGGHQNAHKKEKTTWKRSTITTDHKSLWIEPHALVYNPIQGESSAAQAKQGFKRFEEPWRKQVFEEATDEHDFSWAGSFYLQSAAGSDANQSNSEELDLDLHL